MDERLNAKLPCVKRDELTGGNYYATITVNGRWTSIKIYNESGKFQGKWFLSTLVDNNSDFIYLNFSKRVGVNGVESLIKEALSK